MNVEKTIQGKMVEVLEISDVMHFYRVDMKVNY
jgi:hypothetical protein